MPPERNHHQEPAQTVHIQYSFWIVIWFDSLLFTFYCVVLALAKPKLHTWLSKVLVYFSPQSTVGPSSPHPPSTTIYPLYCHLDIVTFTLDIHFFRDYGYYNNLSNHLTTGYKYMYMYMYLLTLHKLLLGHVKVKLHIETLDKLSDRISVCIRLLQR